MLTQALRKAPFDWCSHQRINREPPTPRSLIVVRTPRFDIQNLWRGRQRLDGKVFALQPKAFHRTRWSTSRWGQPRTHHSSNPWWGRLARKPWHCLRALQWPERSKSRYFAAPSSKAGGHDRNPKDKTYESTTNTTSSNRNPTRSTHRPILDSACRLDQDPSRGISSSTKRPLEYRLRSPLPWPLCRHISRLDAPASSP